MNLFELAVKIGVDDQASGKLKQISSSLGNGLKKAAKVGVAAVATASAGIAALTKQAVSSFAEYEQLVGGVETLFKASANKVQEYAANAYKTAGMSANEYMSTVTSFSASLLQSLGGDTEKAAEYANQALIDMSDNANKMGTDMELIQNAYQGFAKANYTMLDNLKLGYGGTKTEMQRLIKDAAKLDKSVKANDLSFGNIVKAINVVQTEMGITGTTALEAASTISGSVSSMKAAWSNFLTSLADGNGDYQDELASLLESVKTVAGNVFPVVKQVLFSITSALGDFLPAIAQEIPGLFDQLLPPLISAAVLLVEGLAENLPQIIGSLISAIVHSAPMIISGITKAFSAIVKALPALIQMIADELPELVPQIIEGIAEMVVILVENLPAILSSLVNALVGLFAGAWDGIREVFQLDKVGEFFADVWRSIQNAFGSVANWFSSVFSKAWEGVKNIFSTGGEIFSGITEGISNAFKTVVNAIISGINTIIAFPFDKINGFLNLIRNISFLGISPFKGLWPENPLPIPQIPLLARGGVLERGQIGLLEGNGAEAVVPLENNKKWIAKVADDMSRELHGKNGGVNIVQNIYSQPKSAADLMAEALYQQQKAVLLGG